MVSGTFVTAVIEGVEVRSVSFAVLVIVCDPASVFVKLPNVAVYAYSLLSQMLKPDSGGLAPETDIGFTVLVNSSEIVAHLSTSLVVADAKSTAIGPEVLVVLPTMAVMVKVPAIGSTLVALSDTGHVTCPPAGMVLWPQFKVLS